MLDYSTLLLNATSFDLPLTKSSSCKNISAIRWGDPKGEPFVFIHGWLDNCASFLPLLQGLKKFNCIAIDLPGHGLSSHKSSSYHFIDWVDDLHQIINALYHQGFISNEFKRLTLLGHSLGAYISSVYCATFPDKIKRFISIEGLGPFYIDEFDGVIQLKRTIMARSRSNNKVPRSYTCIDDAVKMRMLVSEISKNEARLIVERNLKQHTCYWQWRYDLRLNERSPLRMTESQAKHFCEHIICPVLLIKAKQGSFITDEQLIKRKKWFKNLQIVLLGTGHHLHMSFPLEVIDQINKFVLKDKV